MATYYVSSLEGSVLTLHLDGILCQSLLGLRKGFSGSGVVISKTPTGAGEMLGETTRFLSNKGLRIDRNPLLILAGATRFELATFGVTGRRSNQLNYAPNCLAPSAK